MPDPLLSLDFSDVTKAADRLDGLDVIGAMRAWGAEWGPRVNSAIQAVAPVAAEDGGALRDSIAFAGVETSGDGVSLSWTTDKFYARFQIEGTRAHGPVSAPWLMWMANGHLIRRREVAGIEAQKFFPLNDCVRELLPEMTSSLAAMFEEI